MFLIETARLKLIPLPPYELWLWMNDIQKLERLLDCRYKATALEGEFLKIVQSQYDAAVCDSKNYVWHSFFLIIRKADSTVVGSADFKDVPNADGEVEIGYGLGEEFEHCGYMTETVAAMCEWALSQPNVNAVTAETETDGYASQSVLKRNGFVLPGSGETLWWIKAKTS